MRVWNVVERSSTRCCVQDLLTTLHVHLMDETNLRAEISDCTNVCYTYHTQHQVSTPVIHAHSYGAFCCKPRMTSGSYLRDMWEDPCRSTCYSCTMQVQARGIQATARAQCVSVAVLCAPLRGRLGRGVLILPRIQPPNLPLVPSTRSVGLVSRRS